MAKQNISLISDEEQQKLSFQYQIETGLMTNATYQQLSPDDQNKVKSVLFDMYSNPVSAPQALSALEFTVFGLAKLFFAMFPPSSTPQYGADVQAFYPILQSYIEQHEMTLDPNGWYIPYATQLMLDTKNNRSAYKDEKNKITGSF